jgi:MATE family multidrug resistance protein
MLVPQVNFITNNIFLGRLGETELGTAGITGVFYLIFALAGNGLHSGLQGLLSRRAGENRPMEIGRLFSQGLWISLSYAAAGILLTYLLAPYFLSQSIHSAEIHDQAISFLRIRVWGVPFLYVFQLCNALLVSTSNSRYMKYGFWTQAIFNILLDYALIFGHFGLPQMGFNGAAIASVIAELAGMLVVLSIIFYKKYDIKFSLFSHIRFNTERAGLIFRQSLPLVGQWLISILAWLLFYIFIEHLGKRPLAISNTMRNIFGLFGIFVWAFASTTNAMVSNIIGQGKKEQVLKLVKKIVKLSMTFTFILCALINIFPQLFLSVYKLDNSFIQDTIPVIRMVTSGMMVMAFATVWLNAVTGSGNTRVNLAIEIAAIIIYTLYIYLVMKVWKLGLVWAWSSEPLYWGSIFILSYWYIKKGNWKRKNI